ncbi:MAG: PstS family phosphate ABC transporter substrate-binding protein [Natronomonas sp.]
MTPSRERRRRVSRRSVLAACGGAVSALSGCFVRGEESDLEGEIVMDGSNTVFPHGAAIVEEFLWRNNRVQIPVRGSGTGAGFQRFCEGTTDIQNASRAITDSEVGLCGANGVGYIELEALLDGIAVWVHPDNTWCDDLTVEELHRIWRSGSDVETWSDVDPEWPDEEIVLYGRDAASGTFEYFTEAVNGEAGDIRNDYSASSDTNVIVRGVRGNRYAMGFGGSGYYYENEADLKLLGIDDGDGPVRPTRETVETLTYTPLSRPMFVYLSTTRLDEAVMQAFARFYFEEVDTDTKEAAIEAGIAESGERLTWTQWAARKVGYYAAPDAVVEESRAELEAAIAEAE